MITVKNKNILVLGLGLHGGGAATARWLHKHGARLLVSDIEKKQALLPSVHALAGLHGIEYVLGRHRKKDVQWADYIVANPGVPRESPYVRYAEKLKKPIYNEAGLFFDRCKAYTVAITGTRGKSTTAAYIAAMIAQKNPRTVLVGNIGASFMLDTVDRLTKNDIAVVELSSWQLEGFAAVKAAPDVAVITNLHPDHLNRYKSLAAYYASKKEIWRRQTKAHALILNKDSAALSKWAQQARANVYYFSKKKHAKPGVSVVRGYVAYAEAGAKSEQIIEAAKIQTAGMHNMENALAAVTAAKLMRVPSRFIKKTLARPPALSGRQEAIGARRGILFVNDTAATTPVAGIAALERFGREYGRKRIILIAGGEDKRLGYADWARAVKKYAREVHLLSGSASRKMEKALSGFTPKTSNHNDLGVLVKKTAERAARGDMVLFSPAAASFNLWNHEFERGDAFNRAVASV